MPVVGFTKRQLLRDKIVSPAWYLVLIEEVSEWAPSKDKMSNNLTIEGTILKNVDNGSEEFKDVPIGGMGSWNFNSKPTAPSPIGLIKSCAKQLNINPDDINETTKIELKHLEGKYVEVFIENDTFEGRVKNKTTGKYREPKLD